jgi:phospholipid/cholesterol/gamma-HCH transport system ATP-binding protein
MKLRAVGLYGTQDLMPNDMSGGMARRVALARTIALDPQLIMYDEPFTGLDPISLGVVGALIKRLCDTLGATSVIVTHDVKKSLNIVDYVYYVANNGTIIAEGTADEIRASSDPVVRQFVHGEMDGPIPFHYPGGDYRQGLHL